jgi:hypothetical protein
MPPIKAPIAIPKMGTKKISPKSSPQKAPSRAPKPARLLSWRVLGLLFPWGPGDDRRIHDLDQLLFLQVLQFMNLPVGAVGLREL